MQKKLLIYMSCIFSIVSCAKNNTESGEHIHFTIGAASNIHPNFKLDTLKLESSNECLLSDLTQVIFHNEYIYILDAYQNGSAIFIFDTLGRFINKIIDHGKGPNEVISPTAFTIEDNVLIVLDVGTKKLLFYDLTENQFMYYKDTPFETSEFAYTNNGNILWKNPSTDNDYFTLTDSSEFKELKQFVPQTFKSGQSIGPLLSIYKCGDATRMFTPYSPKIYNISNDSITTKYTIFFDQYEVPPIDFLNQIKKETSFFKALENSGYVSYYNVFETNAALYCSFIVDNNSYFGLYTKHSQTTYTYTKQSISEKLNIPFSYIAGVANETFIIPIQKNDNENPVLYFLSVE